MTKKTPQCGFLVPSLLWPCPKSMSGKAGLLPQPTGLSLSLIPLDWVTHLRASILQGITPKPMASVYTCTVIVVPRKSLFLSPPDHLPKSYPFQTTLRTDSSELNSFAPKPSSIPVITT